MVKKFIAFHSMVTESGKSALVVKTARKLAEKDFRVLLFDGYIYEIGGLRHNICDQLINTQDCDQPDSTPNLEAGRNLYDLIEDYETLRSTGVGPSLPATLDIVNRLNIPKTCEYRDTIMPVVQSRIVQIPNQNKIDFFPGNDGNVLEIKHPFDFDHLFDVLRGQDFFQYLKAELESQYDYILCDAHTGYETLAGIFCGRMADEFLAIDVDQSDGSEKPSYEVGRRLVQRMETEGKAAAEVVSVDPKDVDSILKLILSE